MPDGLTKAQRFQLRFASLFLGFGAVALAVVTGLDGTLKLLGGMAVGFGLGYGSEAIKRLLVHGGGRGP